MFRFANPEYLYLLLLLPLMVVGYIFLNIKKRKSVKKLGDLNLIKQMMPEMSLKRSYLKFWLIFAASALSVIMIARPQFGTKAEKTKKEGIELVIALDVSKSMLAKDISPTRLERAKQIMSRIINERKQDKIALIVYAGEAFVQMPMTSDTESARLFLSTINPEMVPLQGTDIGSAIDLALDSFTGDKSSDKAIVIISDGEDHEGNTPSAIKRANEAGAIINVIGVGLAKGAPIPLTSAKNDFKKDSDGKVVLTQLKEELCIEIANKGNGVYIEANNSNAPLKVLYDQLNKLKKGEMETTVYSEYDEQFSRFAWFVFIILFIEILVFDKKNRLFRNVRLFK